MLKESAKRMSVKRDAWNVKTMKKKVLRETKFCSPDYRDAPRLHWGKLSRQKNSVSVARFLNMSEGV